MKKMLLMAVAAIVSLSLFAQADKAQVRSGNRKFKKDNYREAEIDYRKALLKDSTSFAASYNLASALYREGNYDEAGKVLESCKDAASLSPREADYHFNAGDVALQKKDYAAAAKAFRESLLLNPSDIAAKENYVYAKMMLKDQQDKQNQQQNQQQNQDQNQDQDRQDKDNRNQKDNNNKDKQNQPRQQPRDQGDKPQDQPRDGDAKMSKQQAQQMLKAVQAQEKNTQDKVKKEKAALLKSREKEKNW